MALHRILADLFVWFRANLQVRPCGGTQHEERDDWFRDGAYLPPEGESSAERERRITLARTARTLRLLLLTVVTLTAIL